MSSPFLSSGFDTTILQDGSQIIFAATLGATDLQPGFPVKVDNDQNLVSENLQISDVDGLQAALTSIITNPFNGTLEVQNLITAYDSTPVDLNQFVAATLNDLSDLKSNTQYITSSFGQTQISSNILTNDIDANNYRSQDGSIFIDMATPGDINVSATNFLFNGDPVLTSATGAFLKLDGTTTMTGDINLGGNDIINTATIQPITDGTQDIGTFLNSYKDIYLDGNIVGSTKTTNVNNIITTPSTSNLDMNNFNITNINSINKSGTNILIGPGAQPNSVNIGTQDNANNTPDSFVIGTPSSIDLRPYTTAIMNLGSVAKRFNNLFLENSLQGPSRSMLVNNILSCSTAQVGGNLLAWSSSIVLKVAVDSGIAASSLSGGPFLPLAGGTMLGTLDMANQTLSVNNMSDNGSGIQWGASSNAGNNDAIVIGPRSSTTTDSVIIGRDSSSAGTYGVVLGVNSSSGNNTAGNVALGAFCNASGDTTPFSGGGGAIAIGFTVDASNKEAIAIGSGLNNSTASSLLIGGTAPMVNWRTLNDNTCDLGTSGTAFKDIYSKGSITGATNTRTVDNIVSNSGTGTANNICSFASNKVVQDSGASISTASSSLNLGLTNTISGTGSITVGASNTAGGSAGGKSIIYGNNNNTSGSTNGQCIIYGNDNTDSNAAGGAFIYGFGNTNGTGQRNILIGRNNVVSNGVNEAFVMGFANTNSISNSLLVGGGSMANIRPGSNNLCTLGLLTTNELSTLFARNMDTSAALAIAPTSATSLSLGRAAITTTINGTTVTTTPYGSWYCTASFTLSFSAGVNRLIPPVASSNGPQVDFSFAAGVLTYTGARANRVCQINYNINFLVGPSGANMTFFNSKNGNLTLSAVQARAFIQSSGGTQNTRMNICLTDNVVASNGDTFQLAGSCATLQNITFDLNSCNITGILN